MIIYLFFLHFVSDFILQSREMGKKKSEDFFWLLNHILIILCVFSFGLLFTNLKFVFINAIIHGIIDWNIWKLYKYFVMRRLYAPGPSSPENDPAHPLMVKETWKYWEDSWFYATIGLDQLLHFTTIVILYEWMFK